MYWQFQHCFVCCLYFFIRNLQIALKKNKKSKVGVLTLLWKLGGVLQSDVSSVYHQIHARFYEWPLGPVIMHSLTSFSTRIGPRRGIGLGLTDPGNGLGLTKIILGSGSQGFEMGLQGKKYFGLTNIILGLGSWEKSLFVLTNIILGSGSSRSKYTLLGAHQKTLD